MSAVKVLLECEVTADLCMLAKEWESDSTFLIIPDRSGVDGSWLHTAAESIPVQDRHGRFGLLTSGSTGEPKLILGDKRRSERLVRVLHDLQDGEPVAETVCALPLSYSYAFINQWLWSHVHDRPLRMTPGFAEPDTLRDTLQICKDAMVCMVGSQVALIRRLFPNAVFPGVIRLHFAGGRFPQEQLEFLRARFPAAKIFNNYGCAEAMPRLTLRPAEDAGEAAHVGCTLPGIEMISDKGGKLLFRSPYRAVAFVDDAGFHALAPEDWLPSGDLGEQGEDGSWTLIGRAGEVFKRFGEKISLTEALTTVKSRWDGDAALYREVDSESEQAYVLVLSPEPSKEQLRIVLMGFRKNHTRPHWPLRIESMDQLPILANGKTDLLGLEKAPDKIVHWRQRI